MDLNEKPQPHPQTLGFNWAFFYSLSQNKRWKPLSLSSLITMRQSPLLFQSSHTVSYKISISSLAVTCLQFHSSKLINRFLLLVLPSKRELAMHTRMDKIMYNITYG